MAVDTSGLVSPLLKPALPGVPPPLLPDCRIASSLHLPPPLTTPDVIPVLPAPNHTEQGLDSPPDSDLFLAIDSSMNKMRACLINNRLQVVGVEQVDLDTELPEFGTQNGLYTFETQVRAPSEQRIAALDVLLSKFVTSTLADSVLSRVRAVSGACQSNAMFLSNEFASALTLMEDRSHEPIDHVLGSSRVFSISQPRTIQDDSVSCVFAQTCESQGKKFPFQCASVDQLDAGHSISHSNPSLVQATAHVMLESTMMTSLFLGGIAPVDASDACTTGLLDLDSMTWNQQEVMRTLASEGSSSQEAQDIMARLGHIQLDGPSALGTVSSYFAKRFGFSSDCLVVPFSSDHSSSFLAYGLGQEDVALCLGVGLSDTVIARSGQAAVEEASILVSPVAPLDKHERFVLISNKSAAVARSLVRDLNCNGSWSVFARLTALVPQGGSIGLDNKYFSAFLTLINNEHGQYGFQRFVSGSRVQDFSDRKTLPEPRGRLILQGGAAQNPAIVALSATIFGRNAFFIDETTEMALDSNSCPTLTALETVSALASSSSNSELFYTSESPTAPETYKSTTSALGAAYKAAYSFALERGWQGTSIDAESPNQIRQLGFWDFVQHVKRESKCECLDKACLEVSVKQENEGLTLVAKPDKDEHQNYFAMKTELNRLITAARKGFI
ncbi:hypothetical protein OIV83_000650 [Microbotryomycetes sp. JL201]|nr:hypothetical protein OIV83_000650 [Microbotryomycetes sp. JL201]